MGHGSCHIMCTNLTSWCCNIIFCLRGLPDPHKSIFPLLGAKSSCPSPTPCPHQNQQLPNSAFQTCRHHQRLVNAPWPQNINAPRCARFVSVHISEPNYCTGRPNRAYTLKNGQVFAKEVLLFPKTASLKNMQCISTSLEGKHYAKDPSAANKGHCLSFLHLWELGMGPALPAQLLQVLP